jgi:hypothetical protein
MAVAMNHAEIASKLFPYLDPDTGGKTREEIHKKLVLKFQKYFFETLLSCITHGRIDIDNNEIAKLELLLQLQCMQNLTPEQINQLLKTLLESECYEIIELFLNNAQFVDLLIPNVTHIVNKWLCYPYCAQVDTLLQFLGRVHQAYQSKLNMLLLDREIGGNYIGSKCVTRDQFNSCFKMKEQLDSSYFSLLLAALNINHVELMKAILDNNQPAIPEELKPVFMAAVRDTGLPIESVLTTLYEACQAYPEMSWFVDQGRREKCFS